jgi:tetratricopeptide (TPR) repeat protein
MSTAQELYAKGEALYKAREFGAAEEAFRRLLEVVPQSQGAARGRAAYSLALCLRKQGQAAEARQALEVALEADPTLDRARRRLEELSEEQPQAPEPLTPGGVVGVARLVRQGSEPDPVFGRQRNPSISFRLETSGVDGLPVSPTVKLHGGRIVGSVENGDLVEIPAPWRPGTAPSRILNHTSGETVRAAVSWIRVVQWVVLILFLVGFAVFAVFVGSNLFGR